MAASYLAESWELAPCFRATAHARSSRVEPQEYHLMDAVEDGMWWYRALHTRVLQALGRPRGRVLDAGCGTGGFLARLKAAWPEAERLKKNRHLASG